MIREFALEPAVLGTWERFRYFYEKFGVSHGRIISEFPRKRWKRMVYDALAPNRGMRRMAEIEERLRHMDGMLVRSNRSYDNTRDWLQNAEDHQRGADPFRATIALSNPRRIESVLVADDVDETTPGFSMPREVRLSRKPRILAASISLLLRMSRELLIIDPYFDPQAPRWRAALDALLREKHRHGEPPRRLELHASNRRSGTTDHWEEQCAAYLPVLLPDAWTLRVVRWQQRPDGDVLHPRYILTEIGGVRVEAGLDEGLRGETTDVTLLDMSLYKDRWRDFQDHGKAAVTQPSAFVKIDEISVTRTGVARVFPQ